MSQAVKRQDWIDQVRGLVIILMLLGHSGAPAYLVWYIFGFHMPFFFILSGYLYNADKWEKQGLMALVRSKVRAFIIPYFILSFVNLIINIPIEYQHYELRGAELWQSTLRHIGWIFYSVGNGYKVPNCGPLWFLPAIFLATIYLYFFMKVNNQIKILLAAAAIVINVILNLLNVPDLPWHIDVAMVCMLFMYIGYMMRQTNVLDKKTGVCGLLTIFVIATYIIFTNNWIDINSRGLENVFLTFAGSVLMSYLLMYLFKQKNGKARFLSYMGQNTIFCMAFSYAINDYLPAVMRRLPLINRFEPNWIITFVVDVIVCFLIIYLWNLLVKRFPKLGIVNGK